MPRAEQVRDRYSELNRDRDAIKDAVKKHWESEPCEVRAGRTTGGRVKFFDEIDAYRYGKNPFIPSFARFDEARGRRVLEIGLGSASDFIRWARNGAELWGRDLTQASVELARERLRIEQLAGNVDVGDVEALDLPPNYFDLVYSYGVIHHTPKTGEAVRELYRVTKPGGSVRVMIYHSRGLVFFYEWLILCIIKKRLIPSIREAVFYYNESLGTKLYTTAEARAMFSQFRSVRIRTVVCCGDVLDFELSDRYRRIPLIHALKRVVTPFRYLRPLIPSALGGFMLIEAVK